MPKLKKLTKQQQWWKEALESGYFKQTTGLLGNKNSRCCLGVQCDIFSTMVTGYWNNMTEPSVFISSIDLWNNELGYWGITDSKVSSYFGFTYRQQEYFARLNDTFKLTFKQIAVCIQWVASQTDNNLKNIFWDTICGKDANIWKQSHLHLK